MTLLSCWLDSKLEHTTSGGSKQLYLDAQTDLFIHGLHNAKTALFQESLDRISVQLQLFGTVFGQGLTLKT